jgi:hypothetical protein
LKKCEGVERILRKGMKKERKRKINSGGIRVKVVDAALDESSTRPGSAESHSDQRS